MEKIQPQPQYDYREEMKAVWDNLQAASEFMKKNSEENDKRFKESQERFRENERMLTEKFKETDRILTEKFQETDRILNEKFRETSDLVKNLTDAWGHFVESIVEPSMIRIFGERGIEIDDVIQRYKRRKDGDTMEIDLMGINGEYAVIVEAKSKLKVDDVEAFMKKLDKVKFFFPHIVDKKILGGMAGIVVDNGVDKLVYRKGLFMLGQSGDTVKILNDEKFKPREW